jgi:hypothetical protein
VPTQEVDVAAVHDADGAGFDHEVVEERDIRASYTGTFGIRP